MGLLTECSDVKRRVPFRNLLSQRAQARVVDTSGSEEVSVGAWYELQLVAWAYAHHIEDVCWKRSLGALAVILRSMAYSPDKRSKSVDVCRASRRL